jgi:hypothetical protein
MKNRVSQLFEVFLYMPVKMMILMRDFGQLSSEGRLAFDALVALGEG